MKANLFYIHVLFLFLLLLTGCSTAKNTPASRYYHAMLTRYNIAYNGNISFKEGLDKIDEANKDDYSRMLPLFSVSNHDVLSGASSSMNRSIEKSRKAIKLHSIKQKPKRDFKKMKDPKYRAFYDQNEFNPELKKAWIQLGKSEFYKGDFLGSAGTFSYIIRHYSTEPEVETEAQLWIARAYCEMDWLYEAEDMLKKVKKEHVSSKNRALYNATHAQLFLKQEEYNKAFDFLKNAARYESKKKQKRRYYYALGQLSEKLGLKKEAATYYTRVVKTSPPYEMDFNARISRVPLVFSSKSAAKKELRKMARNYNNKDFLDQVYNSLGNIYLSEKDTVRAIENYDLAIEKSTRNSFDKAVPLVRAGDIYYEKREYAKAHPYYDEASTIYTPDFKEYRLVSHRAEMLGELVKEYEMVHLQDSLQSLANMSEKDRLAAIKRVIQKLKEQEKEEETKRLVAEQEQQEGRFTMPQPIGAGGTGNWYFYNPSMVNNGKTDFRRKWGSRKLEDNWRRINKSAAILTETPTDNELSTDSLSTENELVDPQSIETVTDEAVPLYEPSTDRMQVGYYMAQIPFTEAQKARSNEQIADGLYNMGFIYKDRIEDYPLAYETFASFEKRFPDDERVPETLFQRFLLASKEGDFDAASEFRQQVLTHHPDSRQAEILADPDYIQNQLRMVEMQGKLYSSSYAAFIESDYKTVFENTKEIKSKYPFSNLLPNFEFLNTLSIGKTSGAEEFEESLNNLVANYPENNISALAKDILALLKQGNVAQEGSSFGSLLSKREEENNTDEDLLEEGFSELRFTPHRVLFITDADVESVNKLQYNLAIFNFSRFMIKDFSFSFNRLEDGRGVLSVHNLASYNEGIWYQNTLKTDKELNEQFDVMGIEQVLISEENFGRLQRDQALEEYVKFEREFLAKDAPLALLGASEGQAPQNERQMTVEIIDGTKLVKKQSALDTPRDPVQDQTRGEGGTGVQPAEKSNVAGADLYKDLYAFTPGEPHYIAFYIPSGGKFDFAGVQKALDDYNSSDYSAMNLSVTLEEFGRESIIFVGAFVDLNVAKSYFLRILKDPTIIKATSGMNKRNLLGTKDNLNTMIEKSALDVYFEFMREYYLK